MENLRFGLKTLRLRGGLIWLEGDFTTVGGFFTVVGGLISLSEDFTTAEDYLRLRVLVDGSSR